MIALLEHKTDSNHYTYIEQRHLFQWNNLYDLYAPIMYGSILRLINNKKHAQNILLESFILLKESKLCSKLRKPLSIELLCHTHKVAINYLKLKNLKLKKDPSFYNQNPTLRNLKISTSTFRLANQMENIQEKRIPSNLRNQISFLYDKPPVEMVIPATSLSSFYFFMKKFY